MPRIDVDDSAFAEILQQSCARRPISKLSGVAPALRMKLKALRINTCDRLLAAASTRERRRRLAAACGVDLAVIETLLGQADLLGRIDGIGIRFYLLFQLHGVTDSIRLAQQDPTVLHRALRDLNLEERLLRRSPTLEEVDRWIETARRLPLFAIDA